MRYRLQRHDGTDCSATMVPITVLRMVPIQRYRQNIGYKADGSKAYASYFSVSVPFVLGGLDWTVEAGATPWENDFYTGGENSSYSKDMINGFAVCEVGIEASKEIKISESWSLPLFAKAIWNPSTEGLYFVAGLSF